MHNKVFISYAKEDFDQANELYHFLFDSSFNPWLDKNKLLPSQTWEIEIMRALKESDFIILLLSSTSVSKRGYVQREYNLALKYYEEKLDDDIYLIPLKLNNCVVPEKLSKFQWLEFQETNSFDLILQSLNRQRDKYIEEEKKKIASDLSFDFIIEDGEEIIDNNYFKGFIDYSYPKFLADDKNLIELNHVNNGEIANFLTNCRKLVLDFSDGAFENDYMNLDYGFSLKINVKFISRNFISLTTYSYEYTGGAHGMYGTSGRNFLLNPLREIVFDDIFKYNETPLLEFSKFCKNGLIQIARNEGLENPEHIFLNDAPLAPDSDTFRNFYVSDTGITFIFQPYQETPYSFGENEIMMPFNSILDSGYKLKELKKIINLIS